MSRPPKIRATIRRHKAQAGVSAEEYRRRRRARLSSNVATRHAVFLDVNYWIDLQKAEAGEARNSTFVELLSQLRAGVDAGKLFCPMSLGVFMELTKQADTTTRVATGRVVDQLCCGTGLLADDEIVAFEVAHLLISTLSQGAVRPRREEIWTAVGCMAADAVPPIPVGRTRQEQQVYEKTYFDQLLETSVEDMLSFDHPPQNSSWAELARTLNEGSQAHAHEIDTFDGLLRSELYGAVDASRQHIAVAVDRLRHAMRLPVGAFTSEPSWASLVAAALTQSDDAKRAIPSLYIRAGLHALVRWNRTQRFKPNDTFDFAHASAALGYCDLFFTEGPLRDLLGRGPLRLSAASDCKVISAPDQALAALTDLLGER